MVSLFFLYRVIGVLQLHLIALDHVSQISFPTVDRLDLLVIEFEHDKLPVAHPADLPVQKISILESE